MSRRNVPVGEQTFVGYFRSLTRLHGILTAGQVLYGGMALLARHSSGFSNGPKNARWATASAGMDDTGFYAGLVLALVVLVTVHYVFRGRIAAAREKKTIAEALAAYRQAVVFRDTIGNAIGLFATVAYLLTGHARFVSITGLVVVVFLVWWPTREKCLLLLGLEEDPRVADPNAVIGNVG
ncbi:MAG TPA: hypothetical protein VL547_09455 [Dinghuibacter sp.]|uniref:hypothetical protein n=1 Tax=Dinghuibacter sp. TaxID=2024697 RepID=UPI002D0C38A2|nr:hypothetical protein [Dinghuibacter sp.]HTJ12240.1 hypothetical protein [Dinghuibacter sp.]